MEEYESLIKDIRNKKELSGLDDQVIINCLNNYVKKNNLDPKKMKYLSRLEIKTITKEIRRELRLLYGRFQIGKNLREKVINEKSISNLLNTHSSTKERISFYSTLNHTISSLNVKSILDLGCGLNPLALAKKGINYYALDINKNDLLIVEDFFKKNEIQGKVIISDLRNMNFDDLPEVDLSLILKVLDVIETKGHKKAEEIIKSLKCKYILISFSTKKLSGKSMRHPKREWIEYLLNRLNFEFKNLESENEIFYLVKKF